jgi:methylaspartate mutase epsilon subunit
MSAPFGDVVAAAGSLVVQPRMGFAAPVDMRRGLLATKHADATTVGTITVDSYTRVGDHASARAALRGNEKLNGYPIVAHGPAVTSDVLRGVADDTFPVQVRHGAADPRDIVATLLDAGLHATEGGPVSYCLPYSRTPLAESIDHWAAACERLACAEGPTPHLETFGGCMLGQLCPPALLVALSVLEGLFFAQHGIRSISLSYAQQTNADQDREAVTALRRLVAELLPNVQTHLVVYTYMGVYPRTPHGARRLLGESAALAAETGAARLVVKTTAEAFRIPTAAENVAALEHAARAATPRAAQVADTGIHAQARVLVDAVRELSDDVGAALRTAFALGYLDVPYCLHPDNAGATRGYLDPSGRLLWQSIGALPIRHVTDLAPAGRMTSAGLVAALSHVQHSHDLAPRTGKART